MRTRSGSLLEVNRYVMVLMAAICLMIGVAWGGEYARDDGYRGVWYYNQPSKDQYRYKYSGGFATYPQQILPMACHARAVNKTFFCYGGRLKEKNELVHMVSYYDHSTGMVPRPTILLNKKTDDAHDNPALMLDDAGYIWIFSNAHGTSRPSYIHRSRKPYSLDDFELIQKTNFSYGQPWWLPGEGFLFLHTRYNASKEQGIAGVRGIHMMSSTNGRDWSDLKLMINIEMGDYQVSWRHGTKLGTAFDYHPKPLGLNDRSNLYYVETTDHGQTWKTVAGQTVTLPLTSPDNPALVFDSRALKQLVYLKDVNYDAVGHPVILFLTTKGYESGPANDPRQWQTLQWTGREWFRKPVTTSDHNYDHGSLYIEADGAWRIIAATDPGPQPYCTGGEIVMWISRDQGGTWSVVKKLTANSRNNHTYPRRPVDAHPDFYAIWADGNPLQPSESFLYFVNQAGDKVRRLPVQMTGDFARPEAP